MTEPLLLCATDLEDESAADLAQATCNALGGRILLIHAVGPATPKVEGTPAGMAPAVEGLEARLDARRAQAEEKLEATRARLAEAGYTVEAAMVEGVTPGDAILSAAEQHQPALIVLGRRHKESGLLAKTIDQVCRRGPCPVFVAPSGWGLSDGFGKARWLVGADLSTQSVRAIHAAKALLKDEGGDARIVQIVAPVGAPDRAYSEKSPQDILREQGLREQKRQLESLVAEVFPAARAEQVQTVDRAFEALNAIAEEWDATGVIVGTHGRSGLARLFLGSTAEELLRTSKRPVLVVRDAPDASSPLYEPMPPEPETLGPTQILVATDFSEPARRALEAARDLAAQLGARVSVAHVFDDPGDIRRGIVGRGLDAPRASALPEGARSQLEGALGTMIDEVFGDGASEVSRVVLVGRPVDEICSHATKSEADLVVVGTVGRTGTLRLLLGSVAEKIVRRAGVAVLTVP